MGANIVVLSQRSGSFNFAKRRRLNKGRRTHWAEHRTGSTVVEMSGVNRSNAHALSFRRPCGSALPKSSTPSIFRRNHEMYTFHQSRNPSAISKFQTGTSDFVRRSMIIVFLQECPGGNVSEERLRNIYLQFFPQGSKKHRLSRPRRLTYICLDANKYTHYLFSIMDRNHKGAFTFDVSSMPLGSTVRSSRFNRIISWPCPSYAGGRSMRNYAGFFVCTMSTAKDSWRVRWAQPREDDECQARMDAYRMSTRLFYPFTNFSVRPVNRNVTKTISRSMSMRSFRWARKRKGFLRWSDASHFSASILCKANRSQWTISSTTANG